jgi:hypothetical protein
VLHIQYNTDNKVVLIRPKRLVLKRNSNALYWILFLNQFINQNMNQVQKTRLRNVLCAFSSLLLICLLAVTCSSCSSKSGKISKTPAEKIVILDSYTDVVESKYLQTTYKVKRIELNVIEYIVKDGDVLYEQGDTILWKFIDLSFTQPDDYLYIYQYFNLKTDIEYPNITYEQNSIITKRTYGCLLNSCCYSTYNNSYFYCYNLT